MLQKTLSIEKCASFTTCVKLTESSEIHRCLFDVLDTEQMTGDDGWKTVIELLESYKIIQIQNPKREKKELSTYLPIKSVTMG